MARYKYRKPEHMTPDELRYEVRKLRTQKAKILGTMRNAVRCLRTPDSVDLDTICIRMENCLDRHLIAKHSK